jgi:hypothetical protein
MKNKIPVELKKITASYGRVFLAAALTLYLAGERDLTSLWAAGVSAILPPLVRWLNPSDEVFGRTVEEDKE